MYDGLRSSPPLTRTGPHTWKPYTGGPRSSHKTEDLDDHSYATEQPSLGYATEARRATAQLITHRPPLPNLPPTPRLPSASIIPPLPPAAPFHTYGRPIPPNHYTSPQSASHLSTLKSHLLIPTSGPASLTAARLLASLLFRWPDTRRDLPEFDPLLARKINAIDWTGVESEFHEGSFTQRLVEAWVWSGEGVFGEWEGHWGWDFVLPS
ncbi:hypothetical protein C8A01DRAFT_31347 [Parachaetomium inaequale]|uniref:Uncharacterized protein n=1 Tax=Parachaetomium inaequale TaxID=2588326 RepID=A0AAN6SWE6_9PEZI|nr:hypothetical protein C8A01DRAFT_31347 [Parachaetomium inaequale]